MDSIKNLGLTRGIRKDTGEWIYGSLIVRKNKCYIVTEDNIDHMTIQNSIAALKLFEVLPYTVSTYSHVNDIDDIKIFEGDILETEAGENSPFVSDYRYLVYFDEGRFYADNGSFFIDPDLFGYCKIIGSFYDTPQLITDCVDLKKTYQEKTHGFLSADFFE